MKVHKSGDNAQKDLFEVGQLKEVSDKLLTWQTLPDQSSSTFSVWRILYKLPLVFKAPAIQLKL